MVKRRPGNPILQVRVPRVLHRKVRGLARLYKAPLPAFIRDLLEGLTDPEKGQAFQLRLAKGMIAHQQRELMVSATESWSAPSKL